MTDLNLGQGERIDELQRNGYVIIQDPSRVWFGKASGLFS